MASRGAWLNHGAGPVHGAGAGPSAERDPRARVSGWQLAVQPFGDGAGGCEPSAHRLRAAPAVVLAAPRHLAPAGEEIPAAPGREHRGLSRDTLGEGEAGVSER